MEIIILAHSRMEKKGKGKEYYKNGKLKYKGKFKDDKYEDKNAKFYYENGEVYTGQFQKGRIFGKGYKTDNDGKKIKELNDGPDSEFDILKRNLVLNFLPLGDIFNIKCNRCNHPSKNHIKLSGEVLQWPTHIVRLYILLLQHVDTIRQPLLQTVYTLCLQKNKCLR